MTLILPQSANGQTIDVPAGVHVGTVRLTRHDCVFQGEGVNATRIVADGQFPQLFSGAVSRVTLRDMTLDGDMRTNLTALVLSHPSGPVELILENVNLVNYHRNTIAVSSGGLTVIRDCQAIGNGGGLKISASSTGCLVRGFHIRGGVFGVVNVDGPAGTIPGIDIDQLTVLLDYWAAVSWEPVTPVAYTDKTVEVASHVVAKRSLYDVLRVLTPIAEVTVGDPITEARRWDRLETADGRWTQVLAVKPKGAELDRWRAPGSWTPVPEPEGESATVYHVTLGRLMSWTDTALSLTTGPNGAGVPALAHWRTVEGRPAGTPAALAGSRLDILRKGPSVRDLDTGGIHITKSAAAPKLRRCHVRGGWSDMITTRAPGTEVRNCSVDLGQDMGFTVDGVSGPQLLVGCEARRAGFHGFWVGNGPSQLVACSAYDNGLHADGVAGLGVKLESPALVNVHGSGNVLGLVG